MDGPQTITVDIVDISHISIYEGKINQINTKKIEDQVTEFDIDRVREKEIHKEIRKERKDLEEKTREDLSRWMVERSALLLPGETLQRY